MLHDPLKHAGMRESRHHHEQHTDDDHRCRAESRKGFLGIEHTRNEKNGYGTQEYKIGTELGKEHHGKHRQHRDNRNPSIEVKS